MTGRLARSEPGMPAGSFRTGEIMMRGAGWTVAGGIRMRISGRMPATRLAMAETRLPYLGATCSVIEAATVVVVVIVVALPISAFLKLGIGLNASLERRDALV